MAQDPYREPITDADVDTQTKFVGGVRRQVEGSAGTPQPSRTVLQNIKEKREGRGIYDDLRRAAAARATKDDNDDDGGHAHAHTIAADARQAASEPDVQAQVQRLVRLAEAKGVSHAVRVAQHMSDFYILDKVHDTMISEELYKKLKAKGLL